MKGDMIETYNNISGLEDVTSSQFFVRSRMDNLHGHSWKLYKENFHKVIRKNFYFQWVIDQWNWLPEEVVKAKALNNFKNSLDKYWRRFRH